jgi:hypothetical protein
VDKVFFVFLSIINVGGIAACVWLQLQCQTIGKHWFLRTGIGLFSVGLMGQLLRNVIFLYTGVSPTDADWPLYALKDLGGSMVAAWVAYMLILHPQYLGRILGALLGHPVAVVTPKEAPADAAPKRRAAKAAPKPAPKPAPRRAAPAIKPAQRKAKA